MKVKRTSIIVLFLYFHYDLPSIFKTKNRKDAGKHIYQRKCAIAKRQINAGIYRQAYLLPLLILTNVKTHCANLLQFNLKLEM